MGSFLSVEKPSDVVLIFRVRKITKIGGLPSSCKELDLSWNLISKIENLPSVIHTLNIRVNYIIKIENLPSSCKELHLSYNLISKIENLPSDIHTLNIYMNYITKIENLPSSLRILRLDNNQVTKIENLPKFLYELSLSVNHITKIENLPEKLQKLDLFGNQITKIENLTENLQILDLCYNQITKIENLPNSLQILILNDNMITKICNLPSILWKLDLGRNQISTIENLPNSLQILVLDNNRITKIENLHNSLREINLNNNQIKELPLSLLEIRSLSSCKYHGNQIEHISNPIRQFLNGLTNIDNEVYLDGQNIHNSNIQRSFRSSLEKLLEDKDPLSLEICKNYITNCEKLFKHIKNELINYCDDETEHNIYLITFKEVFRYVISRIVRHPDSNEMFKILDEEINDAICKCLTGRMIRLVDVLSGFYDDIIIQIGSDEQISNIIIMLQNKYEGDELVKQIRNAMKERGYDAETINEWVSLV